MMRALHTAAAGMTAQQFNMDVISNNLANVNTTGFKQSRAEFQDLLYQSLRSAGSSTGLDSKVPNAAEVGLGSKPVATESIFTQGASQVTENPTDMAIQGEGFFKVQLPDGSFAYTRDGSFKVDSNGNIVTSDGYQLQPNINIPTDALFSSLGVGPDGTVSVQLPGQSAPTLLSGKITVSHFNNTAGLSRVGHNLFKETGASGTAADVVPGEAGTGTIAQKQLEGSNVQIVEEMVKLIVAQRAYEVNSKAIQTADEMLGVTNQLKR